MHSDRCRTGRSKRPKAPSPPTIIITIIFFKKGEDEGLTPRLPHNFRCFYSFPIFKRFILEAGCIFSFLLQHSSRHHARKWTPRSLPPSSPSLLFLSTPSSSPSLPAAHKSPPVAPSEADGSNGKNCTIDQGRDSKDFQPEYENVSTRIYACVEENEREPMRGKRVKRGHHTTRDGACWC